jgi:hypothetical protein
VAGTGVAAHYLGDSAAQGFLHTFSGWLMFVAAFVMLFAIGHLIQRLAPPVGTGATEASALLAPGISR